MGTIKAGNTTDPFELAQKWLGRQQQSTQRDRTTADNLRHATLQDQGAEEAAFRKYRGVGRANIAVAEEAKKHGLSISGNGRVTTGGGVSTAIGTKAATAFQRGLTDGGVTNPNALAAVMGHAQIESAGFNPNASGDQGTAHYMLQWRKDRQTRIEQFAQENGKDPSDPYIQGRFAAWEMQNTEKEAGSRILGAKNLAEANEGMVQFLRPAGAAGGMRTVMHGRERALASQAWSKKLTGATAKTVEPAMATDDATDAPIFSDPDGRKYVKRKPNHSQLNTLVNLNPSLRHNFVPIPEEIDEKGNIPYKYYLPEAAPGTKVPDPAKPPITTAVATPTVDDEPATDEDDPTLKDDDE